MVFTLLKANIHLFEGKDYILIYIINHRIISNDAESTKLWIDVSCLYLERHRGAVLIRQHLDETFLSDSTPEEY